MEFFRKLKQREAVGNPVCVGIIGCGQMGSGLAHTINNIVGMRVLALADVDPERPLRTLLEMGWDRGDVRVVNTKAAAEDCLRSGKPLVTEDALLLPELDSIHANVEATGVTDVGARVAWKSIQTRKAIIMLNAETEVTVGYLLNHEARKNDCVYTVASGDEPGVLKMLYEQAVLMGFEVVCLGKGKNNPIDYTANPDKCRAEALGKDMNPKILAAFQDGSKTMVEMAAVANGTGLIPDIRGMHGPEVEVEDLDRVFIPRTDGGIFTGKGRVDYTVGRVSPGVFAVVYTEDRRIRKDMKFITRAEGPYYLHFRPYHLCDIETPQSIAEAVLFGERTLVSDFMVAEVIAVAKRDLKTGEHLGDYGGYDFYGTLDTYENARADEAIPLGLAPYGKVLNDVRRGEILSRHNFQPDTSTFVYALRQQQDTLLNPNESKWLKNNGTHPGADSSHSRV